MTAKLLPMGARVVVQHDEQGELSRGGVVVPENVRGKNKPQEATVVRVGPGRTLDDGRLAPIDSHIAAGARILHTRYAGTEVTIDDVTVTILDERDVLAIVVDGQVESIHRRFEHETSAATPSLRTHLQETAPQTGAPRKSFPVS